MSLSGTTGVFAVLRRFTAGLRYPQLFLLTAALFAVDLVVPDMIPFVDELLLGMLTLLLARIKDRRSGDEPPVVKDVTPRR
jgi:hypothetical protein